MSSFIYFNSREASAETEYSAEVIKNALLKAETKSSAKADSLVKDIKQPVALNEALVFFTDKLGAIKQLSQSIIEVNEGRVKQFETDYADMEKSIKRGIGWIDPEYVATTWENSSDTIDFELVKDEIYNRLIKAGLLWLSDEDGEEKEFQVKSIKDLSESKEVQIYEGATEQMADEENFELYTATLKNKTATVTATTTTKTWPDGIPVLKYLARGKSASTQINIGGSFDVAHDVAHGWFYFTDGRKWFALHREDGYNEPSDLPFEMTIKESAITEGFEVHYSDGIRAFKKFNNERQALAFARDLIKNKSGLQFVDVFKAGSGFNSTAETDAIVAFWGDGSYTDNVSKSDAKLATKKIKESRVNEAMFSAKDHDKTLVSYAIDPKADEIYVISVAKVVDSGFPDVYKVPDKRFHVMFGMMLEDKWLKQYDKLPEVGDILPAPKKDKAFESVITEGVMSEIDIIAKEAKNFKEFVKEFKSDDRYKGLDTAGDVEEFEAWLKSIYDAAKEDLDESVITEAKGSALQDYVEAASQKTFKGGGNGQNLLDEAMGLAGHIDSYALGRDTRGYEEDGFYGPLTITAFKKLVDQMSADDIKNNQADKYESVVTEGKSAGLSKEETLKVAQKFADALAKVDGVKVTVSKGHEEDSFDLDYDGEEFAGGSYNIYKNGDVVNMAVPNYAVYGKMDDDIKTIIKNINKVSNESVVTEGKADYMARYKDTNINLKKAYNHLNDEELNQLYLEIGELIADNKLKVKDATFTFESVVNEKLARGLKPLLTIGSTITKNAGEDALLDLSDQFDKIDDEYAGDIASHLDMAIELMQDGYSGDATKKLKQFNKACMDVLKGKEIGSAFESTVNEAVKEVVLSNEILDFLEERGILKGSDAQKVHKDLTAFLKEKGINESVVTEGKSINKIQKEWSETTTAMSQKVEQWKSAEGDRKIELLDELKALTAKKRALESELDAAVAGKDKDLELVVSEGNAFGAARAEAIAKGEKEFTVDGETYPVESVDDEDKTNAEEFVEESKSDLWSYLIEKHTINEDLRTDIKKYIKSNKKEIDAMADQDNWEGIYSMLMKDFEVREDDVKMADEIKTIFNIVY